MFTGSCFYRMLDNTKSGSVTPAYNTLLSTSEPYFCSDTGEVCGGICESIGYDAGSLPCGSLNAPDLFPRCGLELWRTNRNADLGLIWWWWRDGGEQWRLYYPYTLWTEVILQQVENHHALILRKPSDLYVLLEYAPPSVPTQLWAIWGRSTSFVLHYYHSWR